VGPGGRGGQGGTLVAVQRPVGLAGRVMILAARGYQATLSPYLGRRCRFVPTCSQYFIQAVQRRGALRGGAKGLWRILRCHPFARGGYDPVD